MMDTGKILEMVDDLTLVGDFIVEPKEGEKAKLSGDTVVVSLSQLARSIRQYGEQK